jgi:predicted methyltransferase
MCSDIHKIIHTITQKRINHNVHWSPLFRTASRLYITLVSVSKEFYVNIVNVINRDIAESSRLKHEQGTSMQREHTLK